MLAFVQWRGFLSRKSIGWLAYLIMVLYDSFSETVGPTIGIKSEGNSFHGFEVGPFPQRVTVNGIAVEPNSYGWPNIALKTDTYR